MLFIYACFHCFAPDATAKSSSSQTSLDTSARDTPSQTSAHTTDNEPVAADQTVCLDEDMDLTQVITASSDPPQTAPQPNPARNVNSVNPDCVFKDMACTDADEKQPVPMFIHRMSQEPEFLQQAEINADEVGTSEVAVEKSSAKRDRQKVKKGAEDEEEEQVKNETITTRKKPRRSQQAKNSPSDKSREKVNRREKKKQLSRRLTRVIGDSSSETENEVSESAKMEQNVFKVPAPVTRDRRKTFVVSASCSNDDQTDGTAPTTQRSRSKRRAATSVKSYAESEDNDTSKSEVRTNQESDSEAEKVCIKFSAFVSQPGKIAFRVGRTSPSDIIAAKTSSSKSHSMLPRAKPKSKSRSKPRKVPDFFNPVPAAANNGGIKSVFDLSLNESVTIAPSQTTYSDFKERQASQIEPGSAVPTEKTTLAIPKKQPSQQQQGEGSLESKHVGKSPHGIMLVLGNGKRTKPRRPRSKIVSYSQKIADVHIAIPQQSDEDSSQSQDDASDSARKQNVGVTPPRLGSKRMSGKEI